MSGGLNGGGGAPALRVRRVYAPAEGDDGRRVLADRLWPRGLSREAARLDEWVRELAPSDGLRRWYGHEPDRFAGFQARYRAELEENPAAHAFAEACRARLRTENITLLCAARDETLSNAAVLRDWIRDQINRNQEGEKQNGSENVLLSV